ncbi:MAG: hypothetical protein ACETVN_01975 [Asgard group archaeon]
MTEAEKIQVLTTLSGIGLALCVGLPALISSIDVTEKKVKITNTLILLLDIRPTLWVTAVYYLVAEIVLLAYLTWPHYSLYKLAYMVVLAGTLITFGVISYFIIQLWRVR